MKGNDLTHTISEDMTVFPGSETQKLTTKSTYEKDGFKETLLQMYSHVGTHMDPPAHIFTNQKTLDQFSPEQFIDKALVVDCRDLKEGQAITIDKIDIDKAKLVDFLLFNLGWDKRWNLDTYFNDYPCIDNTVLEFILNSNFKGIGFDVMGLEDPLCDENLTRHKALFKDTDIVNIENLTHLEQCGDELFWFSCFQLKIENCDGFPIRAIT